MHLLEREEHVFLHDVFSIFLKIFSRKKHIESKNIFIGLKDNFLFAKNYFNSFHQAFKYLIFLFIYACKFEFSINFKYMQHYFVVQRHQNALVYSQIK